MVDNNYAISPVSSVGDESDEEYVLKSERTGLMRNRTVTPSDSGSVDGTPYINRKDIQDE